MRFLNHRMFRHPSRNLPLNDSFEPFYHGLPRIDVRSADVSVSEPLQDRSRHKLRTVIGSQIFRRSVHADELGENLNDAP